MSEFESSSLEEAYLDRNLAVQVLARLAQELGWDVGLRTDPDEPDWPVLFVELVHPHGYFSLGQVSWHLLRNDIVGEWPEFSGEWDGHNLEEKRKKMRAFLQER